VGSIPPDRSNPETQRLRRVAVRKRRELCPNSGEVAPNLLPEASCLKHLA